MKYGVPYRGSKNEIAEWVVENLPPAKTFVDIFAGGCAVTHCAMLSGKFEHFVANDLSDGPQIFLDAIHGEYEGYATVPTCEEFKLSEDPLVKLLYSFGNNNKSYLWSRDYEPVKVAASKMLSAPSLHERRLNYRYFLRELRDYIERCGTEKIAPREARDGGLQGLQGLERLEGLQGLEGLERLQGLERLKISKLDYRKVDVPPNATVYADPPYRSDTKGPDSYGILFDPAELDAWLAEVPFPVIVSEYDAPAGCVEVASRTHRVRIAASQNTRATERLFVQERFLDEYRDRMAAWGQQQLGVRP